MPMPTQETIYEVADRVATITLNRPDKLNAWTATMEGEVRSAVEEAERDENVRGDPADGSGPGILRRRGHVLVERRRHSGTG